MHPQFEQHPELIYLNHAAVAPWPRRTAEAVTAFARENRTLGSSNYARWLEQEQRLRQLLRELINAPSSDDIALQKNTSEALSTVAYGIDWQAGDNIVTFLQEFPSNRIVWESLRPLGVETRLVDLSGSEDPEQSLFDATDGRTRLISCSSVQYGDGLRLDLGRIGGFCRANEILFCVDAIQSLGALPFDLTECHADFVVADGHKWMLGPEGLALLYVAPRLRGEMKLHQFGWHMTDHPGDFDRLDWQPSSSATRFECGSPNMLGLHALVASLELIMEQGIETIAAAVLDRSRHLRELIETTPGFRLLSSAQPSRCSGITTFTIDGVELEGLYRGLMAKRVICARRGGGIRFSPHFYTPLEQLERAVAIAHALASGDNASP